MDNTINTGLGTVTTDTYDYINNLISNPTVILISVIIMIIYIIVFMSLGQSNSYSTDDFDYNSNSNSNSSSSTLYVILVAFFIILIVVNGLQYFFGIDIVATIRNFFTEVDIVVDSSVVDSSRIDASNAAVPELLLKKQVFNIPGNDYVYPDAKALCSAYGARLATYKEVEESYNEGGEWCNYGWSDGQMALFPTQQKTFDGLQKIEGHENDCGRPGVNGGYMANPALKFGVNCFGYKPRINSTEEELMANEPLYPKTLKDVAMENRVNYWKDKLATILVSPFNSSSWSRI